MIVGERNSHWVREEGDMNFGQVCVWNKERAFEKAGHCATKLPRGLIRKEREGTVQTSSMGSDLDEMSAGGRVSQETWGGARKIRGSKISLFTDWNIASEGSFWGKVHGSHRELFKVIGHCQCDMESVEGKGWVMTEVHDVEREPKSSGNLIESRIVADYSMKMNSIDQFPKCETGLFAENVLIFNIDLFLLKNKY